MNELVLRVHFDKDDMVRKCETVVKDTLSDAIIDYLQDRGVNILELEYSDRLLDNFIKEIIPLVAENLLEDEI